uniref:RING-type domain-containing protein n=1 Tax=Glossina brevipalpis TaxID=37001 RepID=A0A1A9WDS0_9MUSC
MSSTNSGNSTNNVPQQESIEQASRSEGQVGDQASSESRIGVNAGAPLNVGDNQSSNSNARVRDESRPLAEMRGQRLPSETLEKRMADVLLCEYCFQLQTTAMHLCQRGHTICAPCLTLILMQARMYEEMAKCPACQIDIFESVRNIPVENAIAELSSKCHHCQETFPHKLLDIHERQECHEFPINCKNARFGCVWSGPRNRACSHERNCEILTKTSLEIAAHLETMQSKEDAEKRELKSFIDLMNNKNLSFTDLQLRAYYTDDNFFYETKAFESFGRLWVIKAKFAYFIDSNKFDYNSISYQLILTDTDMSLEIKFAVLKGPYTHIEIVPHVYRHNFNGNNLESAYCALPLKHSTDYMDLKSHKDINFRLMMCLDLKCKHNYTNLYWSTGLLEMPLLDDAQVTVPYKE